MSIDAWLLLQSTLKRNYGKYPSVTLYNSAKTLHELFPSPSNDLSLIMNNQSHLLLGYNRKHTDIFPFQKAIYPDPSKLLEQQSNNKNLCI